ncbi:MAG: hypothetical protein METHSR3v1_1640001, partial [Methanothrix sp.]
MLSGRRGLPSTRATSRGRQPRSCSKRGTTWLSLRGSSSSTFEVFESSGRISDPKINPNTVIRSGDQFIAGRSGGVIGAIIPWRGGFAGVAPAHIFQQVGTRELRLG